MYPQDAARWPECVMSDLLPCPHCGSAHVVPELVRSGDQQRTWTVVCAACSARIQGESATLGFEDAVARWNERRTS